MAHCLQICRVSPQSMRAPILHSRPTIRLIRPCSQSSSTTPHLTQACRTTSTRESPLRRHDLQRRLKEHPDHPRHIGKTRNSSSGRRGDTVASNTFTGDQADEPWKAQKAALKKKFGSEGWAPRKKLSPDAMEGVRELHAQSPQTFTTSALAERFEVSPEAIRRILKSKWRPSQTEQEDRRVRWEKRGEAIWSQKAELGIKPPRKWREMGITNNPETSVESSSGHHISRVPQRQFQNGPTPKEQSLADRIL